MSDIAVPRARPPFAGTRQPRMVEAAGFTSTIGSGWAPVAAPAPIPPGAAESAAGHREQLAHRLPDRQLVIAAGTAPRRSADADYPFRAHSDFVWSAGCQIEGGVLVLSTGRGTADAVLFAPPPARPGEPGFFSDALHGELWVGASPALPTWSSALGIPVRPLGDLDGVLARLPAAVSAGAATRDLPRDPEVDRAFADLRMIKDDWEITQLRDAVRHTVDGFAAVASEIPRAIGGLGERWLQGTFDRHARTFGNGPGYASIIGSGPHAPTLHWVRCDGPVLPDATLLLDLGMETTTLYTADVTRTVPPSGSFSPVQRQVHDLVEAAHRAGMALVRPGVEYGDFHFATMEVLARGLDDWGLLPVSVDEALNPQGQQHRRYLVCGIGHHLGLDVHDCLSSRYEDYQGAPLQPGMVLTVEPGLYFHANDLTVPPELRGIGVRLEDDLLVTADGAEVLSAGLPIDAAGIESWTARHLAE